MFTIDYFINKFEAIPFHKWTRRWLKDKEGKSCALGHCGPTAPWEIDEHPEAMALIHLFMDNGLEITNVNDLSDGHPKMAVIDALRNMK